MTETNWDDELWRMENPGASTARGLLWGLTFSAALVALPIVWVLW